MSKAVMLSIQPKWCELIASGKKTIEVRKNRPQIETPFKCYIYQTKKKWMYRLLKKLGLYQSKVIGEFICDSVYFWQDYFVQDEDYIHICDLSEKSCVDVDDLINYAAKTKDFCIYGWHISDLVIYDKPRELREFKRWNKSFKNDRLTCPPQSWMYIDN